jgi:hypothetical protein
MYNEIQFTPSVSAKQNIQDWYRTLSKEMLELCDGFSSQLFPLKEDYSHRISWQD